MSETITIKVTREHIDKGVRGSFSADAIALAAKDQGETMTVDRDAICVRGAWRDLPPLARQFIAAFDAGAAVGPVEFDVEVPEVTK